MRPGHQLFAVDTLISLLGWLFLELALRFCMRLRTTAGVTWIGVLGLGLISLNSGASELRLPDAAALAKTVFKVRAIDAKGKPSNGTAVLVAPGKLVTACHVTRRAQRIEVVQDPMRWTARPHLSDIERDLCILSAPGVAGVVAALPQADLPEVGQPVFAVGYPWGGSMAVKSGVITALHSFGGSEIIQASAAFDQGQSGGALFDRHGRLVGVLGFKALAGRHFHFSLPVDWIPLHALTGSPSEVLTGDHAGAFWEQSPEFQPFFLRAASFEASGKWASLRGIAERWVVAEAENPHSWLALSNAFQRLNRHAEAAAARRRAEMCPSRRNGAIGLQPARAEH